MNKILEIILGLILIIIPIYVWITNWMDFGSSALTILKGGIIWILLLSGLILLVIGIADLSK